MSRPPVPHPPVMMPQDAVVMDLSGEWDPPPQGVLWTIGRYLEPRGIYTQPLFAGAGAARTVHLGLDLGGPEGVAVHAVLPGVVAYAGHNPADGDYGHVVVLRVEWQDAPLWVLYGHLSAASLPHSPVGRRVGAGAVLGWLGGEAENGGWPTHLHVQLSRVDPGTHDMPGACTPADVDRMRRRHPDPAELLGPRFRF